jgi:hypothetical protein
LPVSTTTSAEVPGYLPVAIAGHTYLIDPAGFQRETVPVLRQQADTSNQPGEASLNPRGLWRRSQESWHHGAGQEFLDGLEDVDPYRYRTSRGVDPWTQGKLSLLPITRKIRATTNDKVAVMVVGSRVYTSDGTELYFSASPTNYVPNPTFDSATTDWAATNATIAVVATPVHAGAGSLQITSTSSSSMYVETPTGLSGMAVSPSTGYRATVYARAATAGRQVRVDIIWYTAAGAAISTSSGTAANDNTFGFVWATVAATAPATAAFASVRLNVLSPGGAGEIHYLDDATMSGPVFSASVINAGEAAQSVQSMTTDGNNVWAALGTSGIHRTIRGATTSTANVPGPGAGWIHLVSYSNGRLLAAGSHTSTTLRNVLFEVVDPLGTPALGTGAVGMRFIHPNTDFEWTFIAPGRNCIYAGGNSGGVLDVTYQMIIGGNAEIYRIGLNPVDTSLTAPTFATYLPDGEAIHALQFYAGGVIMGTSKGVRTATVDGQGNLDYGPLIETPGPVFALEPQGRYVWVSFKHLDQYIPGTTTVYTPGLARLDLGYFTAPLVPAWAPDLEADFTGDQPVTSIASFTYASMSDAPSRRYFAIPKVGVYAEDAVSALYPAWRQQTGNMDTGAIRFSTTEEKITRSLDYRHHTITAGAVSASIRMDGASTYTSLGSSGSGNGPSVPLSTGNAEGESVEVRMGFTRSSDEPTVSPELVRWTLKALPTPRREETFTLPIILKTAVVAGTGDGVDSPFDVEAEIEFLKGLEQAGTICKLQLGEETFDVFLDVSRFKGEYWNEDRTQIEGTYTVQCQTVAS